MCLSFNKYVKNSPKQPDNRYTLEDPWDVTAGTKVRVRSCLLGDFNQLTISFLLALLAAIIVFLAGSVRSQSTPPPPEDFEATPKKTKVFLDRDARELAEDYIALLEQLQYLAWDYHGYFVDLDDIGGRDYKRELIRIARKLQDTSYYYNCKLLMVDIAALQDKLMARESKLGDLESVQMDLKVEIQLLEEELAESDSEALYQQEKLRVKKEAIEAYKRKLESTADDITYESNNRKLYRLTKSLHRELEMVNELLEKDIADRLAEQQDLIESIQIYIRDEYTSDLDTIRRGEKTFTIWLSAFDDIDFEIPGIPELPEISLGDIKTLSCSVNVLHTRVDVPTLHKQIPQVAFSSRKTVYESESGKIGILKELVDSTRISSDAVDIYVVNPTGTLDIVGWDRNWIVARYEIEVTTDSRSKAESLINGVKLRLYERNNIAYIESVIPNLTDPQTRIISNKLTIKAPADNRMIGSNSFGKVSISGFNNEVELNTNHSTVTVSSIEGDIEVMNKNGRMQIADVTGKLDIKNAYGSLVLSECDGEMRIENAFSSIDISDSRGNAFIRNSGAIRITDFSGSLNIETINGPLEVRNVDGNLVANNSMNTITIEDIRGSVRAMNVKGAIRAVGVDGPFSATNIASSIAAEWLVGPVELISTGGTIDLALDWRMSGHSTVSADYGIVNLLCGDDANLLVMIETNYNLIENNSTFPTEKEGTEGITRLELGQGENSLVVSGNNTSVVIYGPE